MTVLSEVIQETLEGYISGRLNGGAFYRAIKKIHGLGMGQLPLRVLLEDLFDFLHQALDVAYAEEFDLSLQRAAEVREQFLGMAQHAKERGMPYSRWFLEVSNWQKGTDWPYGDLSEKALEALVVRSAALCWAFTVQDGVVQEMAMERGQSN